MPEIILLTYTHYFNTIKLFEIDDYWLVGKSATYQND